MRIPGLYQSGRTIYSFEFFPPRSDAGYRALYRSIAELKTLGPGFVSVTSHARGENRARTAELVIQIQRELGITAMAHLPCATQTRDELGATLDQLQQAGIRHIMALRGDPPPDQPGWRPGPDEFRYASELTAFIHEHWDFTVGGGCYPETHHEAPSAEADLDNLKRKLDAGAEFLVTQLFLNNAHYFRFLERARAEGIVAPIVPGIMPMTGIRNLQTVMRLSPGSETPAELARALEDAGQDTQRGFEVGVEWATRQCLELLEQGVPGIHFYTLNRSSATRRVHQNLRGSEGR